MSNFTPSGVKFLMDLAWARLDGGDFKVLQNEKITVGEQKWGPRGGILSPLHYPHQNNVEQDLVTPLGVLVWLGRLCTAAGLKSQKIALSGRSPDFFCQKGGSNLLRINIFEKFFFRIKQALKASKQSWFFNVIIIQPHNTYLHLLIALLFHI